MQDENYRQILFQDKISLKQNDFSIHIQFRNQLCFIVFICLILISHSNALPVTSKAPFPFDTIRSTYKIYRHSTPSPIEFLKRERYRRKMIEKLFSIFDEDIDGQLSKDELYSLSLRLNIFPKFHQYLKNSN